MEKRKWAILESNTFFNIIEITSEHPLEELEQGLRNKNQTALYKQGIWEVFYGTWAEVKARVRKIEMALYKATSKPIRY